jgi:hypothetical protein
MTSKRRSGKAVGSGDATIDKLTNDTDGVKDNDDKVKPTPTQIAAARRVVKSADRLGKAMKLRCFDHRPP